jgi:hypothetical protein
MIWETLDIYEEGGAVFQSGGWHTDTPVVRPPPVSSPLRGLPPPPNTTILLYRLETSPYPLGYFATHQTPKPVSRLRNTSDTEP